MLRRVFTLLATIFALTIANTAHAYPLYFNLDPVNPGYTNLSWVLDSNPTPDLSYPNSFVILSVPTVTNGVLSDGTFLNPHSDIYFVSNPPSYGGVAFSGGALSTLFAGDQVYSGTTAAPIFSPGTFHLDFQGNAAYPYLLTISRVGPSVPEPATWAMMLIGFAAVGASMRRRQKRLVDIAFQN